MIGFFIRSLIIHSSSSNWSAPGRFTNFPVRTDTNNNQTNTMKTKWLILALALVWSSTSYGLSQETLSPTPEESSTAEKDSEETPPSKEDEEFDPLDESILKNRFTYNSLSNGRLGEYIAEEVQGKDIHSPLIKKQFVFRDARTSKKIESAGILMIVEDPDGLFLLLRSPLGTGIASLEGVDLTSPITVKREILRIKEPDWNTEPPRNDGVDLWYTIKIGCTTFKAYASDRAGINFFRAPDKKGT